MSMQKYRNNKNDFDLMLNSNNNLFSNGKCRSIVSFEIGD